MGKMPAGEPMEHEAAETAAHEAAESPAFEKKEDMAERRRGRPKVGHPRAHSADRNKARGRY